MKTRMIVTLMAAVGICLAAASTHAQPPATEHTVKGPADIEWVDAPPVLIKGAKMAVLFGDPSKPGLYILRMKFPAKYKVMPHWHPTDENVTVISGGLAIGHGDTFDAKTKVMPAGSFFSMPAKMHHFALTKKATVIEIAGIGPFAINYVNPADDPSKAAPPAAPPAKTPAKK